MRGAASFRRSVALQPKRKLPLGYTCFASACACGAPVVSRPSVASLSAAGSYLVDPASSHMLVSKIKPCMSKCK